jgi:hypothetical protein
MLPVSLDFPFLLPLRYSLTFICPLSDETYVINVKEYRRGNKNEQSRETGNIGYTRHRTNKC